MVAIAADGGEHAEGRQAARLRSAFSSESFGKKKKKKASYCNDALLR